MIYAKFRRLVLLSLTGGVLVQFGGCVGSLIPSALATGEQVFLSVLLNRVL